MSATLKNLTKKRMNKKEREQKVLLSLVDLFIKNNQPIGSKTLMESSFSDLSAATIRNYFSTLEEAGYLVQQHASGGRIPTELAYQIYAQEYVRAGTINQDKDQKIKDYLQFKGKEVGAYLQKGAEHLSAITGYPCFMSSPRFDYDFVVDIKLVKIDSSRCLCIVVTELGLIHTETLYFDQKLNHHGLKRIEEALLARLKNQEATRLDAEEELLVHKIYNEVMVRYIIGYTNYSSEEVYTTGLSRLLSYPEFKDAERFASGLALFENKNYLRELLRDSSSDKRLKFLIGKNLAKYSPLTQECAVITLPYTILGKAVGAIAILGPMRMPYRELFGMMQAFTEYMSQSLTQAMVKHKLTYRTPQDGRLYLENKNHSDQKLIGN